MGRQGAVLSQIQALYEAGSVAGLTDAQLVERFVNDAGEGAALAFSALVERHGPMVMRVCRASLRNEHDAEDAFQAVFLVLVRKAGMLWVRDSLGPWLHAVAVRTSAYARAQSERRRARESRPTPAPHDTVEEAGADLVAAIHEEVGRLPDRFREAVVLCDLEGLPHELAAARLGWPVGTVKSRQARGRERLRGRLRRRGLAPGDAAFGMALAPLPVAAPLARATAGAACTFKAGAAATAGAVSATSAALARGVLRTMTMSWMRTATLSILAVGTIATGTLAFTAARFAADEPRDQPRRGGPPGPVVPTAPRPPAGSVFELRIAADPKHDPDAPNKAGYRWVKVDPKSHDSLDGLITRDDPEKGRSVLVKLDPQNLTERDLLEVKTVRDERGGPAISFRMTPDGARRFGALTRSHLPEGEGAFKYRLALIVQGVVVSMPAINSEIRDAGIIQFGEDTGRPAEFDRLVRQLADAAAYNAPPPRAKAVKDQAEAIREAKAVDLPALAEANGIAIERATGTGVILRDPKAVARILRALRPGEVPPGGGEVAATLSFLRGDELIRKVWVYEGGEWGFERPGTSWTTGSDAELWRLVETRPSK